MHAARDRAGARDRRPCGGAGARRVVLGNTAPTINQTPQLPDASVVADLAVRIFAALYAPRDRSLPVV
jgi:hypothetical protein